MQQEPNRVFTSDDGEWWDGLYRAQNTPWDIGTSAPPFKSYLDSPYCPPLGKVLVPGCGTGNDCLLFATRGFEVTGLDFAPTAIQITSAKFQQAGLLGSKGFLLQRDLFNIHEYDHYFDYIVDHSCFCAIHPSKRRTYAYTIRDLLKPGGKLIGLWWLLDHQGGPPWSVNKDQLFDLFREFFDIELAFAPSDSIPERRGREIFTVMVSRP